MNHPEQNMKELSVTSPFNKEKWTGLISLLCLVETVEYVNLLLRAYETGDGTCPASEEYAQAFPALLKAVQEGMDAISAICAEALPSLEKALEQFEYEKLQAIANCSKKDCVDRDTARKELGWLGEKKPLLL